MSAKDVNNVPFLSTAYPFPSKTMAVLTKHQMINEQSLCSI